MVDKNYENEHFLNMRHVKIEDKEEGRREGSGYPLMPLKLALRIPDAINELGGAREDIPKSSLAHFLKEEERSPMLLQRISSAKAYGMIQGRASYRLTEASSQFYHPTAENDKQRALRTMFSSPDCFKKIIKRFDGAKLPDREILGNILYTEFDVPKSWKVRVASFFIASAEYVGVLDDQRILRLGAAENGAQTRPGLSLIDGQAAASIAREEVTHSSSHGSAANAVGQLLKAPTPAPWGSPTSGEGVNPHTIRHGEAIMRVETPLEFEMAHWEKLNAYVQYLKSTAKEGN